MYELLIIGSGPAGLAAAIYAKRANLDVAVIEKEYMGTGQIAESGRVDNYPGFYGTSGFDLGEAFRTHAEGLGTQFLEKEITGIRKTADSVFVLECEDGESLEAKSVIYAAGAYPRKSGIEGEDSFIGKGVSFCALCDGAFYKGKSVVVLGGGDTALDDAVYLSDICEKVYLIHRRGEFRGSEKTAELLRHKENVSIILNEQVIRITGEKKVSGVELKSGEKLMVDGVFVAFGSVPNSSILSEFVKTDDAGYIVAGEDGRSSLEGLFVAGDVRTKPLRQVVTAVSDGANAVVSAQAYLKNKI